MPGLFCLTIGSPQASRESSLIVIFLNPGSDGEWISPSTGRENRYVKSENIVTGCFPRSVFSFVARTTKNAVNLLSSSAFGLTTIDQPSGGLPLTPFCLLPIKPSSPILTLITGFKCSPFIVTAHLITVLLWAEHGENINRDNQTMDNFCMALLFLGFTWCGKHNLGKVLKMQARTQIQ
jgi:hypothetical protein